MSSLLDIVLLPGLELILTKKTELSAVEPVTSQELWLLLAFGSLLRAFCVKTK